MNNSSSISIKKLVYTSLAVAMVTILTYAVKIPSVNGYINFGDIFIFTTAAILGKRTALIAGGLGSSISDLLAGYVVYSPATLVIKGLEGLVCALIIRKSKDGKISIKSLILGGILGAIVMIGGYFIYETIMFGLGTALSSIFGNVIQGTVSVCVYIPFVLAINKTKINFEI